MSHVAQTFLAVAATGAFIAALFALSLLGPRATDLGVCKYRNECAAFAAGYEGMFR